MQADIDVSDSDVFCIKECIVDGAHAHFVIMTKDMVIRLLMGADLMARLISLLNLSIPEGCKPVENVSDAVVTARKVDTIIRAVDVRVGGPSGYRGPNKPELRLYTGKKKKHSVHLNLSWGQMALLKDLMVGLQRYVTPSIAVA